MFVACVEVCFK